MQIPKKIRVGGIDYPVKLVPNPTVNGNACLGVYDSEKCVIELNNERDMSNDRLCQTLLHEILHAVAYQQGLEREDEESIVTILSRGLFQVLQDNPTVFAPKGVLEKKAPDAPKRRGRDG